MIKLALLILAVPYLAHSQVLITDFCGTNSTADPTIIGECEAQSSSNVEPSRSGFGLKKRDGFSTAVNMAPTATSIKSAFIFKNQSGVEVVLASDQAGNVRRSANFASSTHLSTITAGARLYCKDNDGTAYCFTSSNDAPFSYDGTTYTEETLDGDGYINGKLNLFIQDRHLVAGATDFLNRLYISKSGDWDNFTGGLDEVDAWTEDIGRNGDRITGLLYLNGRVVVFKEFSIGAFSPIDTQFNSLYYNISDSVGISDPEAVAIHNGIAYLKASDNNFYAMDGNPGSIERISGKIKPDIANFLTGLNRRIILTTKADWDGGDLIVSGIGAPMSTTISPGSVMPSSTTKIDTNSADFGSGTLVECSTSSVDGDLTASISFENAGAETEDETNWGMSGPNTWVNSSDSPRWGARRWDTPCNNSDPTTVNVQVWDESDSIKILENSVTMSNGQDTDYSIDTSTLTNGKIILKLTHNCGGDNTAESLPFVRTSSIVYNLRDGVANSQVRAQYDIQEEGFGWSFTGRTFDTQFATPTLGNFTVGFSSSVDNTATFQTQSSVDGSSWDSAINTSPGDALTNAPKRYLRYLASGELTCSTCTYATINEVSLLASTTGQYQTSCIEPGSGISAWGTLEVSGELQGVAGLGFEDRVGANCAGLGSYVATSSGATIGRATSAAYQVRVTFELVSATETARVDSLTVAWSEGSVPPASSVAMWDNSIYIAVSSVTGSNNQVFRYIPSQGSIWPFALKTNQMIRYKDKLYMTSTTDGSLYQYSAQSRADAPTSDAGTNIIANWRSKLFSGGNPFVQSIFTEVSLLARDEDGGDVNVKWRLDGGDTATGNYDVGLSTGSGPVRYNFALPVGQRGQFFDLEFSDDSTEPFEILGIKLDGKQLPWRVIP